MILRLADIVLDVDVVYLYLPSAYIRMLPVGFMLCVPMVYGGWYSYAPMSGVP